MLIAASSRPSMYMQIIEMRVRLNTVANMTMHTGQHQSVAVLRIIFLAKPMAESQRISQQRQYRGRWPLVTAGGVPGAK